MNPPESVKNTTSISIHIPLKRKHTQFQGYIIFWKAQGSKISQTFREGCVISVRLNDIRRAGYGSRVGTETAVDRCCPHLCTERFLMVWQFLMRTAGHHWHWEHSSSNVCTAPEKKTYRPSCFQWRLGVCSPADKSFIFSIPLKFTVASWMFKISWALP